MNISEQIELSQHSTMRLGGKAAYACNIASEADLLEAISWAKERDLPFRMIGSGSNIIWRDEGFNGLIMVNQIMDYRLGEVNENESVEVTVGAGENWDSFVARTVDAGLSGVEALSLIPGTCGATPIQNVGAYGQDVSQTLTAVKVYDTTTSTVTTLNNSDCQFGYRTSRFNRADAGRFLIIELAFRLSQRPSQPPYYPPVAAYLDEHQLAASPQTIRQAVVAIRTSKLPDPADIGNTGSFFSNPIIGREQFEALHNQYTDMRFWEADGGVKISGAWLIEQAGYKDYHDAETGMATWTNQPLVVVNENAPNTAALLAFKQKIVDAVQTKFGITLEQEPELLP